jgi:hypothetical protein
MAKPGVASSRRSVLKLLGFGLGVVAAPSFAGLLAWAKTKKGAKKSESGAAKAPVDEAAHLKPG